MTARWSASERLGRRCTRSDDVDGGCSVLRVVANQQLFLLVSLRELQEDERGAEQDRDDADQIGPLVSLQEGGLRGGDDVVLDRRGVALGGVGGAREGLRELRLDVVVDVRTGCGDRRARGGGIAGREDGSEDRLHDRAAEVAL